MLAELDLLKTEERASCGFVCFLFSSSTRKLNHTGFDFDLAESGALLLLARVIAASWEILAPFNGDGVQICGSGDGPTCKCVWG